MSLTVTGGNLVLVIVVALIALGALAMAAMFRAEVLAARRRHRKHEDHRPSGPGRSQRLSDPPVPDPGRLRRHRVLRAAAAAGRRRRRADLPVRGVPRRCGLLRRRGLPGHEPRGAGQPAGGHRSRDAGPRPGDAHRLPHRRHGRHADRGPGSARREPRGDLLPGQRTQGPRGLRLRCRTARDVHAGRRRHLHQGRRRGRRPGRQGREQHPRGRPAQRRHHRRQRRRQRRRLRRHGRRPLRVLRRHPGRRADPRLAGVRRQGPGLPAAHPRHRRADRRRRRLPLPAPRRRERPEDHQPGLLHLGRDRRRRLGAAVVRLPARRVVRARRLGRRRGEPPGLRLGRRGDRHRAGRRHPVADRLLHRHRAPPGPGRRQDLAHRRGHRHPLRTLGRLRVGRLHRARHRCGRLRSRPHRWPGGPLRRGAGRLRPADHGRRDRGHGHLRSRSPTTPRASRRCRAT